MPAVVPPLPPYPYGYEVYTHTRVVPTPALQTPGSLHWRIAVSQKTDDQPLLGVVSPPTLEPHGPARQTESEITVQLTADQQVELTVSAEDAYDNPVDISAATPTWASSDEAIVTVQGNGASAVASAVGPVGTAAVTVSSADGQYQGSLAIDVVAGEVTEIVIEPGEPTDKTDAQVDNSLPGAQPGVDNSLPGDQPVAGQSPVVPEVDPRTGRKK